MKLLIIFITFLIKTVLSQELLPNARCNHYPERGSCEISFEIKWYYDRFDHRCRRFHYGGCDGNENRFDSLTECEQSCHFDPQIDETSSRRCFQPHDPGNCWGNFERWYFDSNLGRCVCSWWSGCGGNSNRFYSYPHCMQICGEHAIDRENNDKPAPPENTVYEAPMQRMPQPLPPQPPPFHHPEQYPPHHHSNNKPATTSYARPLDTQPLGGGVLYPSHVMTPQHPPIYDDPELFKIQPVFENVDVGDGGGDDFEEADDEAAYDVEEFETDAYKSSPSSSSNSFPQNNPSNPIQEWSAKTETRFFPNLGLRNKTFILPIPKLPTTTTTTTTETPEPVVAGASNPDLESGDDNGMLLNLRPPAEFQSKTKKRNVVEEEIVETQFRTTTPNRQSRRSSGVAAAASQPPKENVVVEEYETEFQKRSPSVTKRENNYENYETAVSQRNNNHPQTLPPQLGYTQAPTSRNSKPRTQYHEVAETQFLRHSYINPPVFPGGFPILKSLDSQGHRIPQPVPQALINQLIAQHLALRERLGQTQNVPVIQVEQQQQNPSSETPKHSVEIRETPYRRFPTSSVSSAASETQNDASATARAMTYVEKRRRWKEEMKKKLKKQKIPPRQIIRPVITGEKNKYYVTYSPYYRLYQVSRNAPKGWNQTTNNENDENLATTEPNPTPGAEVVTTSPSPPTITSPTSTSTPLITTTTTTTTTTPSIPTTPKIISLKAEPIIHPQSSTTTNNSNKMQIRVAAIKPTPKVKGKQLLYMDDEDDEWKVVEEEDYYVDDNGQAIERQPKTTEKIIQEPATTLSGTEKLAVDDGMVPIVFPINAAGTTPTPRGGAEKEIQIAESTTTSQILATTTKKPVVVEPQQHQAIPFPSNAAADDDDGDFILPSPSSADKQDYVDYGHSEEDLFFWKPDFEQRRTTTTTTKVNPSSSQDENNDNNVQTSATSSSSTGAVAANQADDGDAFEITVHNPEKKKL